MPKTIRELADELKVSKQTIQYHYQRLPTKNRQKDSQGKNVISLTAERIIRDKVAKNQQTGSKKATKTSKENNELIATLRREVADLKSQRDKQLATKDQQISNKDRQIDQLTKLIDQQQQLQLTTVAENKKLKNHIQKLSGLLVTSNSARNQQENSKKEDIHKNKINKSWWHFW